MFISTGDERRPGSRAARYSGPTMRGSARRRARSARAARQPDRAAPVASIVVEDALRCSRWAPTGSRGRAVRRGVAAVDDQRARPLGIGRGEQRAIGPPSDTPNERRPLGADGVHHGPHVVHPLLERRQSLDRHRIGQPGAALVEEDQPRERREPLGGTARTPARPRSARCARPSPDEHQVDRSVADDLVGDVDVAAPRVLRRWWHVPAVFVCRDTDASGQKQRKRGGYVYASASVYASA